MDYDFTEQQNDIVELARMIGEQKIKAVREHYDQTEEFPWPVIEEIRKADLFGVYLPEQYGGLGGGVMELVLVAETFSRFCAGIALSVAASGLCAIPILIFGNAKQREKWLPDLASGKRLGAFTITEPAAGSDATATKATAKLEGDHYILRSEEH